MNCDIPAWVIVLVFGWLSILSIPGAVLAIYWMLERNKRDDDA